VGRGRRGARSRRAPLAACCARRPGRAAFLGEHTGPGEQHSPRSMEPPALRVRAGCGQSGSLPPRQAQQRGLCSGNKPGPQLNDKPSSLRFTATRLVDGAFPWRSCAGPSSITAVPQASERQHGEAAFLPLVMLPSRHGAPSGPPQPHSQPDMYPPPGPRQGRGMPAVPVLSRFQLRSQESLWSPSLPISTDPSAASP